MVVFLKQELLLLINLHTKPEWQLEKFNFHFNRYEKLVLLHINDLVIHVLPLFVPFTVLIFSIFTGCIGIYIYLGFPCFVLCSGTVDCCLFVPYIYDF